MLKRAAACIKDKKSLVFAHFSAKRSHRNHDFEAAIIKATNHDEHDTVKRNAGIDFEWILASPSNIYHFVRALTKRIEKNRSWVVAIKGLMLMHDLVHCKVPAVKRIGRLPFDLSRFRDGHSRLSKTCGFNLFIRQYFTFLNQRGVIWLKEENKNVEDSPLMVQQLLKIRKWQFLLDLLLKIRPRADNMKVPLIFEAMDCLVVEIFDVYSRIHSEIAKVLLEVHSIGKPEAAMALEILRIATKQGEELSRYLEFCKEYGVSKANEFVTVIEIPKESVKELERRIDGVSDKTYKDRMTLGVREDGNAIVEHRETMETLKATVTDRWERITVISSAAGIKDMKSLVVSYFSAGRSNRNHDFDAAIIKATNHDEHDTVKRNAEIVLEWIRASPNNLYHFIRALTKRIEKTRSWVVAIKGLMLMHDLVHCKVSAVKKMGRLPFDLSRFNDGHSRLSKTCGFNLFILQYFEFLDERGAIWLEEEKKNAEDSPLMVHQILKPQKWLLLLDMLLKIRPRADNMKGKPEATMALEILRKAKRQGVKLSRYFKFCKEYGVSKADEIVTVFEIPEEYVKELERRINGVSDMTYKDQMALGVREEDHAIVEPRETTETLKTTTITERWDVFHDDINTNGGNINDDINENNTAADQEAGATLLSDQTLVHIDRDVVKNPFESPEFTSF
ncbi:putative Homeobox protein 32 [Hibiscus syriacus]|uniref:Homeobox protein 32 n=1 Tax=Hibiscus syriacus TaxID=106335 RepID=A0A6A3B0B4_HIBSY|nr:putative Homeobox protein 32 [Hibiscus syriacus]